MIEHREEDKLICPLCRPWTFVSLSSHVTRSHKLTWGDFVNQTGYSGLRYLPRPHTNETKQKLSRANLGKVVSQESIQKQQKTKHERYPEGLHGSAHSKGCSCTFCLRQRPCLSGCNCSKHDSEVHQRAVRTIRERYGSQAFNPEKNMTLEQRTKRREDSRQRNLGKTMSDESKKKALESKRRYEQLFSPEDRERRRLFIQHRQRDAFERMTPEEFDQRLKRWNSNRKFFNTGIELRVQDELHRREITFETQKKIGSFSIDIYLPEHRVCIECDGIAWHTDPDVMKKDQRKNQCLQDNGYTLIRLKEADIWGNVVELVEKEIIPKIVETSTRVMLKNES